MLTRDLVLYKKVANGRCPTLVNPEDKRLRALLGEIIAIYETGIGEKREILEERLEPLFRSYHRSRLLKGLNKLLLERATFEAPSSHYSETRMAIFKTAVTVLRHAPVGQNSEDYRHAVSSLLLQADKALLSNCFGDLPQRQILSAFETIDAKELLHEYNRVLVQSFDKFFKSR